MTQPAHPLLSRLALSTTHRYLDAPSTASWEAAFGSGDSQEQVEQRHHTTLARLREVAESVAREAAAFVAAQRAHYPGRVAVRETKSSTVDPVTEVDQQSEALITARLAEFTPQCRILGEESGGHVHEHSITWIVDPIDGTVNYIYGIPAYAVSIAAVYRGIPLAAAVADVASATLYSAVLGGDANRQPLKLHPRDWGEGGGVEKLTVAMQQPQPAAAQPEQSAAGSLTTALIATGFSYLPQRRKAQAELLAEVLPHVRDIRRRGSAALDLCFLAGGEFDGYYEHGLGAWDFAAGALIAARAGAAVIQPEYCYESSHGKLVAAARPEMINSLVELIVEQAAGGALYPL